jgi:microcystin degradation protein MlrC
MRVFIGSITHETNAFSPIETRAADYQHGIVGYSDLIAASEAAGHTVIAGPSFRAAPSAPTARLDYEHLRDQLLSQIHHAGDIDSVLLALHGAQVADGYPDCESDIVQAVRALVGNDVIVGVMLDLHAAIGTQMLQDADLVTVIKEYPHTDYPETARQLVDLAARKCRGDISPVMAFVPVPVFTLWHTPEQPSKRLVDRARELERNGEVLHISLVHGFPWSDVAEAGAAVIVITDGDKETAALLAKDFAQELWSIRDTDMGHYLPLNQSVARARSATPAAGPMVIADTADNPGAGCGGDGTWVLHELISQQVKGAAMALFHDPASLRKILAVGAGNNVELCLGGWSGALAGAPFDAVFEVIAINYEARIDALPGYQPIPVGPLACIHIAGIDLVIGQHREQVFGPRVFTEVGIIPEERELLVVKSAQHFYNAFAPIASSIVYCDSPCSRTIEFSSLPFRNRRVPMWPLEPCTTQDIPQAMLF